MNKYYTRLSFETLLNRLRSEAGLLPISNTEFKITPDYFLLKKINEMLRIFECQQFSKEELICELH